MCSAVASTQFRDANRNFRVGKFYWNNGSLINIFSRTHERKAQQGKTFFS